jgi:hypothetical protein
MNMEINVGSIPLEPLPLGWEPIGAIVLLKCKDSEGETEWAFRTSESLEDEETLGALEIRTALAREWILSLYRPSGAGS